MAITLAQAKVGMADKVDQMVIDEFRRGSLLMDELTFDDSVSPGTGGSTLVYGYERLLTPSTADFRNINSEYSGNEAIRKKYTTELKIFGGEFAVDRVIANTSGSVDEVQLQLTQKIAAATNLFHYTAINGDKATKGFDGLDLMLAGSSTEINADVAKKIDLSTPAAIDTNYALFLMAMDDMFAQLDSKPSMIMANSKVITKIKACARKAGYLTRAEDAFGKSIEGYDGVPIIDMKEFYNGTGTTPIVPIVTRGGTTGLTDIYVVRTALDGFHATSPAGGKLINTTLPDFTTAGAVKKGDVEMVAATVLKSTKAAGVLRNIKVI